MIQELCAIWHVKQENENTTSAVVRSVSEPRKWTIAKGTREQWINTLRPRQNGRHFPDDIFKRVFLNEKLWISIRISLKFVPKGPITNITALVQIMAWHRPGDKSLSEPIMVS